MLDAYLQDTEEFPVMLRYCNIIYKYLPMILTATHNLRTEKEARKLAATTIVAAGFGGDMPEELANALLEDMDFFNNRVKYPMIEQMLPKLMKMVEGEERSMR